MLLVQIGERNDSFSVRIPQERTTVYYGKNRGPALGLNQWECVHFRFNFRNLDGQIGLVGTEWSCKLFFGRLIKKIPICEVNS